MVGSLGRRGLVVLASFLKFLIDALDEPSSVGDREIIESNPVHAKIVGQGKEGLKNQLFPIFWRWAKKSSDPMEGASPHSGHRRST